MERPRPTGRSEAGQSIGVSRASLVSGNRKIITLEISQKVALGAVDNCLAIVMDVILILGGWLDDLINE
jgi:hypothetical protein